MKWYNKDNTKMIDLDQVASFDYKRTIAGGETIPTLTLNIAGQNWLLYDDEAREVYNKLTSDKQVL